MSSLEKTKYNGSFKSVLHLFRYIVLIMAFFVVGMVSGNSKVEAAAVAKVGSVQYSTLQAALNAYSSSSEQVQIDVISDTNECLTVSGYIFILNLQDVKISCSSTTITVMANTLLALQGSGTIESTGGVGIYNNFSTNITSKDITVIGSTYGIYNYDGQVDVRQGVVKGATGIYATQWETVMVGNDNDPISTENPLVVGLNGYGFISSANNSTYLAFTNGKIQGTSGPFPTTPPFLSSDATLVVEGNAAYYSAAIEEVDSSGSHVAYHNTLQGAFNSAVSGNTLVILLDTNSTCAATVESGKTFTLDLNGHILSCNGNVLVVNGTLNVFDNVGYGSIFMSTVAYNVDYEAVLVAAGGRLVLNGAKIEADGSAATNGNLISKYVGVKNSGTLIMNGGTIRVVRKYLDPYGVYNSQGSEFTMNDGDIYVETTSGNSCWGVYMEDSSFEMNGGAITSLLSYDYSSSLNRSYGIRVVGQSELVIDGGYIYSTSVRSVAYGVDVWGATDASKRVNVTIKSGSVEATGGNRLFAIYISGSNNVTFTLGVNDGTISKTSPEIDGNIEIDDDAGTTYFYDGVIKANESYYENHMCMLYTGSTGTEGSVPCSVLFDDRAGAWYEDDTQAYTGNFIEQLNPSGNHVAYYKDLATAFSNLPDDSSSKIKLLSNISACDVVVSPIGVSAILDLNGFNILCAGSGGIMDFDDYPENVALTALRVSNFGIMKIIGNGGQIIVNNTYNTYGECGEWISDDECNYVDRYDNGYAYGIYNEGSLIIEDLNILISGKDDVVDDIEGNHVLYGIYNKGALTFISGSIRSVGEENTYSGVIYYPIHSEGDLTIGVKDGNIVKDSPELIGRVNANIEATNKFYDGKLSSQYCSQNDDCSSVFDEIEDNSTWITENGYTYLKMDKVLQEVDSSGNHVAYYESLSVAFSSGVNGNKIKLLENISECNVNLASGKTLTLDLNGKSVTCTTSSTDTKVLNITGNLTIMDSGTGGTFKSGLEFGNGILTIGVKDGNINLDYPVFEGGISFSSIAELPDFPTIKFYDGKIKGSLGDFTFNDIESNAELKESGGYVYLEIGDNKVQELTPSGNHVAYYKILQAAFDNASNGNTIKLLDNLNECTTVSSGRIFTLDLNGKNIKCGEENEFSQVVALFNHGDLTIKGSGKIEGESTSYVAVAVSNLGNLIINGGTFVGTSTSHYGFGVNNEGSLIVNGGNIQVTGMPAYGISNYGEAVINNINITTQSTVGFSISVYNGIDSDGKLGNTTINGGKFTSTGEKVTTIYVSLGDVLILGGEIIASSNSDLEYSAFSSKEVTITIGKKDGSISTDNPYLEGDLRGTFNLYDGKIKGGCYDDDGNAVAGVQIIKDIEKDSTIVEENGFIYLRQEKKYNMFQAYDGSGALTGSYVTLSEAVEKASSGSTIKFIGNVFECVTISSSKTLTFNLNGKTLSCSKVNDDGDVVAIVNNGTLNISGDGSITVSGSSSNTYAIHNTGTLNVSAGFISATAGSAVGIYSSGGRVSINGGTIRSNSTSSSGSAIGVRVESGSITISGGVISSASDVGDVYGVFNSGTFTMSKGVISATSNLKNARGVYNSSGTSNITGGAISSTSSLGEAYGVSASDATAVNVSATSSVTATSMFGIAQELKEEIIDDLINIPGGNDKAPKLYYDVVEGIDSAIICSYGSVCDIDSLTFVDYNGILVNEVSNTIRFNGSVVSEIDTRVLGTYVVTTVARDSYGNVSKDVVRTYNVVDNVAPEIKVSSDAIVIKVGESLSGLYGAKASDNYDSELVIEVLDEEVDTSKEGTYKLGYKVVDSNGNETIVYRDVIVKDNTNINVWLYIVIGLGLLLIGLVGFVVIKRRF